MRFGFAVDPVEQIVDVGLRNPFCRWAAVFVRSFGNFCHQGAQGWFTTASAVFRQQFQKFADFIELVWQANVLFELGSIDAPLLSEYLKQECTHLAEPSHVSRSRLDWSARCLHDLTATNLQREMGPRPAAVVTAPLPARTGLNIGRIRELDLVNVRAAAPQTGTGLP
jgi:hypothetical protein